MTLQQLITNATAVFNAMLGWVGDVMTAIFNPGSGATDPNWSSVAPFLFIGLGITLLLTSVGIIRSFIGGRNV